MSRLRLLAALAALSMVSACSEGGEQSGVQKVSEKTAAEAAGGEATSAAKPVRRYDAATFFQTTNYSLAASSGHAFSPDGKTLLITSDQTGVFNAYTLPLDGGAPAALTNSAGNAIFAISWFPADGRILYTSDGGGDELNHVYVREENGDVRDLTPGEKLKAAFAGWRADGKAFYVATNERDPQFFDLYEYSVDGYSRQLVFRNEQGFGVGAVSGDGRCIALEKPRTSADSDIWLVDRQAEDPSPKLITAHEGNVDHSVFEFTPDGKALIYGTDEFGEFRQAWSYDLATGAKAAYVKADWDVSYVSFSPSGRYRVAGVNADASTEVTIDDLTTGKAVALPDLPRGDLNQVRFNRTEDRIAFLVNADVSPSNVHVVDLAAANRKQLTQALNPAMNADDLVESRVVRYKSFDGLEIPAILYRPKDASPENRTPALVWVHGGPGGQSRTGYSAVIQHLVNHGYAVLAANNRGSSGYGKTFFHMDDKKHGEVDLKDIVHGRKYLESLDWVDAERIGIIGGSYGGYMVVAALAFEPDAFDVGIDIFGVTNWVRTLTSIPPWWASFKEALYDEMGDPAVDGERHRRISPLFHAKNIRKPLLVVQGTNDPRVLKVESDEIVAAVRANGVPVEYVVFDDEGHGFRKRENRIAASEAYVRFLDRYLKGGEAAEAAETAAGAAAAGAAKAEGGN